MTNFIVKNIITDLAVGDKLKAAREQRGLTIAQVSARLKIGSRYLIALEQGSYQTIPGEVYAKSFLKSYASFLRLPVVPLLEQYAKEKNILRGRTLKKTVGEVAESQLIPWPKILRLAVIFFLGLLCLFYLGDKVRGVFAAPSLQILEPDNNLVVRTSRVRVTGITDPETDVSINSQRIAVDDRGNFSEQIDLQNGVNYIKIVAANKRGRQTNLDRQVIYNPTE